MKRSTIQKVKKEILDSKYTLNQLDLTDIHRTLHPTAEEYTFCSSAQGIFPRIDHMLHHKTSLNKYRKTEIISSIFLTAMLCN